MAEHQNVGVLDSRIRILLGVACVGLLVYHFAIARVMPIYVLVVVAVGVPFFLKTGLTRVCPIMKALGVSTARPSGSA